MKQHERPAFRFQKPSRRIFCFLLILTAFVVASLLGARRVLLDNARYISRDLIKSYAMDEVRNLEIYENLITLGMDYLNDQTETDASQEEIEDWLIDFFHKAAKIAEDDAIECYAVVNGQVISPNPWPGIEEYDAASASWYQQAMEAKGEIIFTDAYTDSVYHRQVVTVAAAFPETGNAIAFDLFPENFQAHHSNLILSKNNSYYVCDTKGTLLYQHTSFEASENELKEYAKDLCDRIHSGSLDGSNNVIRDLNGTKRGIYYYQAPNGWLCILTLPYATLLDGLWGISIWCGIILVLLLIVTVFLVLRSNRLRQRMDRTNDTLHVLGNSYYAIYRINTIDGVYEMIKGSDYAREHLPYEGDYEKLLTVLTEVMDEKTGQEFAKSFSLENIRLLRTRQTKDFGGDFRRIFGDTYRWVNVRLLLDSSLHSGEAILCFREIEEEKQRQLKHITLMEDALVAAESSEQSQKQFFSNMSHDMRTPLNVIIGMADLALRPDCTQDQMIDYLNKISVSGKQLLALINDILEISRLEQGRVDLDNSTFNICETLESCIAPFQTQAQDNNKIFELHMDVKNPVVCGDPFRLTQILNNLISNAVKFTQPGDRITVSLRQTKALEHNKYLFTIEDTGAGMSEEFLPHLFEPYEREIRFGAKNVLGTGLGMPIVKNLISQMGGQITVHSVLGEGSRFCVALPFTVSSCALPEAQTPTSFEGLSRKRILIAEDNPLNMEIAIALLQSQEIQTTPAENGQEALDLFRTSEPFSFDAILMDMQMPEMDGCTSARSIRSLDRADAKTVPIIALTANAFAEDIVRTTEAGMNAHLSKPIDAGLLFTTLEKLLTPASGME